MYLFIVKFIIFLTNLLLFPKERDGPVLGADVNCVCLPITVYWDLSSEVLVSIPYLAAMFIHYVHCSSNSVICRFTLFHLSLHILLKIWTNQKIIVSPFICCCSGLCLNHSIDATNCWKEKVPFSFSLIIHLSDKGMEVSSHSFVI